MRAFDENGFYPKQNCQKCQKPLQGQGEGRPAELYAGTFTGLCYECQNGGDYIFKTEKDGARHVSCAPSCPSWRRDRENYISYADCKVCKGVGYSWKSGRHDSYRSYCEPCLKKHSENKFRVKYFRVSKKLLNKYSNLFLGRIKAEEKRLKIKLDKEACAKLSTDLWEAYSSKIKKLNKILDKLTL